MVIEPEDTLVTANSGQDTEENNNKPKHPARKRRRDEEDGNEPRKRKKFLLIPLEELARKEEKMRLQVEMEANGIAMRMFKNKAQVKREKGKEEIRSIPLAFFPKTGLEDALLIWIGIADRIAADALRVLKEFAENGTKPTVEYLRDEYFSLTTNDLEIHTAKGTLNSLKNVENRLIYKGIPTDVVDRTVGEAYANFASAQTNFERGHIQNFQSKARLATSRFKALRLPSKSLSIQQNSGEVCIYPRHQSIHKDADRGVYLKDTILMFLLDRQDHPNNTEYKYLSTKYWGNHLLCGKGRGG